jgi:diguanylate cyclase (GGDEF)-like protein/PAS domain S-box-containing protein
MYRRIKEIDLTGEREGEARDMINWKDLKISKLLTISQILIIVLVLTMGVISAFATQRLWHYNESLRNHPFTTQAALAAIQNDALNIRLTMEEVVIKNNPMTSQTDKIRMDSYEVDANKQIKILENSYLGPKDDLDEVKEAIQEYHSVRVDTLDLLDAGNFTEASKRVRYDGICGVYARALIMKVNVMNDFATNKADELYQGALHNRNQTMWVLAICIIVISLLISAALMNLRKNIVPALKQLTNAADNFKQGNPPIKINYESSNELGILANSFQTMTERIESEVTAKIKQEAILLAARKEISMQAELLEVQAAYYVEKQLMEATLVSIGDGVISCDKNYNIIFLNKVAENLTGWNQENAVGLPIEEVFDIANEITLEKSENIIKKVILSGEIAELANHTVLISKDVKTIPIEDSAAPIFDESGNIVGAVLVFRDVTEKRQKLQSIEYLSYHDELTGLYNRRFYEEEMKRIDTPRNLPLTIVMGDVNGLKLVNDSFGHVIGDELLKKAAKAIKKGCRADDIIARLGGDEFIAILPNTGKTEINDIINRIKTNIDDEKIYDLEISISFGYGTKEKEGQSIQEIFKSAEDSMYRQKLGESSSIKSKTIDLIMNTLYEKNPREQLHSKRVSETCEFISHSMNLSEADTQQMKIAGLMHDIGKIGIDENVLNSPGLLNHQEWEEIKRHSEVGYRILSSCNEFAEIAISVLEHHERWDGKGYPKGLQGEEISLAARIIAIADSFDAMTGERTYKASLSNEEALEEIMKCAGTQFDPNITKVFVKRLLMES